MPATHTSVFSFRHPDFASWPEGGQLEAFWLEACTSWIADKLGISFDDALDAMMRIPFSWERHFADPMGWILLGGAVAHELGIKAFSPLKPTIH